MPDNTSLEEETLGPEHLALAQQSRAPAIQALADDGVHDLLDALREAVKSYGKADEGLQGASVTLLRAAMRRVEAERRKRGLKARPAMPVAAVPAAALSASAIAVAAKPRKPATISRKPAGRKTAEARKTDLRTEPHRLPRGKKSAPRALLPLNTDNDHLHVTRDRTMPTKDSEKAVKQAERKAEKLAAKQAEKEAAKAERKAAKEAERDARRAARKAEKTAQKEAEKEARKAERKAAAKAEGPAKGKSGATKPKAAAKSEGKAAAKPAAKNAAKPAAKATVKAAAKPATKSGSKTGAKTGAKSGAKTGKGAKAKAE
ncbi:hypothetical protein [Paracoccus sp. NSM]|uniref:hypothetical protein n=1 Tax=Paracoccus sp. NSM TaxID=3457784 RepID=UPI0040366687